MNSEQSLDLWSDISLPEWMRKNSDHLEENLFTRDSPKMGNKTSLGNHQQREEYKKLGIKRQSPVQNNQSPEFQEGQSNPDNGSSSINAVQYEETQKNDLPQGSKQKTKLQRRCQNSRKYRQRKREYVRSLQEQNKLLKSRIDDLNFQLCEMHREINRLKHRDPRQAQTQTFHTTKQRCMRQMQQLLLKQSATHQQLSQAEHRLRLVLSFTNKQKVDYLNYFMSELLQNVITDRTFYFVDCLINKVGIHRESYQQELRRIDVEVIGILDVDEGRLKELVGERRRVQLGHQARRLKELWKKLYQVYLAILNQGMRLDRFVEPMKQRLMSSVKLQNFLRVQLHFQRNRHRSDIRYMRNSWFRELTQQPTQQQTGNEKDQHQPSQQPSKRTKPNQ